jgi:hypothetical protein
MAGKSSLATPTASFATSEVSHVSSPSTVLFPSQVCVSHASIANFSKFDFGDFVRFWLNSSISFVCYRVDGEARRVLWLLHDSEVSITERRFGNPNFDHLRRRFSQCYRRIRSRFVVDDSSFEDQSRPFAAEISQTNLSPSERQLLGV